MTHIVTRYRYVQADGHVHQWREIKYPVSLNGLICDQTNPADPDRARRASFDLELEISDGSRRIVKASIDE